jgi:hypothetical protein
MKRKEYAYRFDLIMVSHTDIPEDELAEVGLELKEAVTSFFKSKRWAITLEGDLEIFKGEKP